MRRALLGLLLTLAALAAVLLVNTWRLPNPQLGAVPVAAAVPVPPDTLVAHLAGAVRLPTVSRTVAAETDTVPFAALGCYLERTFPRVHAQLSLTKVNRFGRLYTWAGTEPGLPPLLLLAHQDVVPVAPGTVGLWAAPPFGGQVKDGYLYGRGTLDDKLNLMGQLEAVEYLLGTGFRPRQTVLLAYGHDEETSGMQGAAALAAVVGARYPTLALVLDEGGLVKTDGVAGLLSPVALVGIAEKGYLTVELTAHSAGGHSSMPGPRTSVGRVARAVARLEEAPFPARLDAVAGTLAWLAPAAPLGKRVVFSNPWLFSPFIKASLAATPAGNATLRTTTAPTIIAGGDKDNVLPPEAKATINFRLLPGDPVAEVLRRVKEVIADTAVHVRPVGVPRAASPVSGTGNEAFTLLHHTIRSVFPTALVAPYLVVGATDARTYARLCPTATYRFMPVPLDAPALASLHGTNERLPVRAYPDVVRFYAALIKAM